MNNQSKTLNVFEYEELARQKLSPETWARPNLLVDVERIDISTTVLGQSISAPILIATIRMAPTRAPSIP
jgi:isopentenyl diphosphate isomerase/L-lactate dehydrogenase-like FMN-dependent dehydrogenase